MAARLVQAAAGPLDRPTASFLLAAPAESSNWISKAPACDGIATFCQAPELITQLAAATVSVAAPLWPSLVAVIVAGPPATPVARPLPLTVATAVLLLAHVTVRPVSVFPAESLDTAVNCCVAPTRRLADAGLTVTDATGTFVTVTAAVPLFVSLVAVIVAEPAAFPLTTPLLLTVAAVLLLAHVTTRPVSVLPAESLVTAVNCRVAPTGRLAVVGLTVTDATGILVIETAAVSVSVPPLL